LYGQTVTISALDADGQLITSTGVVSEYDDTDYHVLLTTTSSNPWVITLYKVSGTSKAVVFVVRNKGNDTHTIVGAKLELGPVQTLAHWDGTKYVRNEIPDYSEELRKCRRYYRQSFDGANPAGKKGYRVFIAATANGGTAVSFDEPMAGTPTVKIYDPSGVEGAVQNWTHTDNPSGLTIVDVTPYGFGISGVGKLTAGTAYNFHYTASAGE